MKQKKNLFLTASLLLVAGAIQAQTFTGRDLGAPSLAGSVVGTAPGVQTITGGGSDIWGTSDNGYYVYTSVSGQKWDAKVRVQDLQGPDAWTKCELMVRVPDASGIPQGPDRFVAAMTTRAAGQNEVGPQYRANRGGDAGNANFGYSGGTVRPTYPNTWLRLVREGSTFTMYYGTNGTSWTKYCDINTAVAVNGFGDAFPDTVLVGVAVTAHNDGDTTGGVATVSDLAVTVTPSTPVLSVVTQVQPSASAYVGSDAFFSFVATNSAVANGSIGNYQWYKNDKVVTNANSTLFAVFASEADNGAKVYCKATVGAVSLNSATGTVSVTPAVEVPGSIKYQVYSARSRVNINSGSYGAPSRVAPRAGFEAPADWSDNYGARLSGYFIPKTSGDYVFFICADDDADLFISTDSSSANCRWVAAQEGWAGARNWVTHGGGGSDMAASQRRSDSFTPDGGATYPYNTGIPLVGGQKYFLMATHGEGGGGDNLGVYAKLMADPDPTDGLPSNLTNDVVSMLTWPAATTLNITTQPKSVEVFEGLNASMTCAVATDSEFTPLYQWQRNQVDMPGQTGPTIRFAPANVADNGAKYRCVITVPNSSLTATTEEATLTVRASVFITGIVKQEIWGPNNTSVTRAQVEAGTAGDPTSTKFITMFDTPDFADNYVQKLSTWFVPATSGAYVFILSSDDDSDLFLSTNDDPLNKRLIAQQTSWNGNRDWAGAAGNVRRSDSWAAADGTTPYANGISLTANTRYYIEAVHHEGGGGDNLAVYARLLNDADPANGTPSNLQGTRIGVKLPAPTSLEITTQPQSVATHGWDPAIFTVAATTDALYPPTYQWRRGGVNIPNATMDIYSFVTGTNDNGAAIDCVVTLSQYGSKTSAVATVTVLADAVFEPGTLKQEYFPGVNWQALLDGSFGAASQVATWTILESATNVADNFSQRVSGFFIPPVTGDYVFITSSDDQSNFYISTDDQPKNKRLCAQQSGWNDARMWIAGGDASQRRSDAWSPDNGATTPYASGIPLEGGKKYYIEVLHREGSGGENLAATFKLFTDPDPVDGDAPLFTGAVIGHMKAPAPTEQPKITITRSGNSVQISWSPAGGHLESKAALGTGPWTSEGAANPVTLQISGERYFRVVVP